MYAFLDVDGNVLATSTMSRTVAEVQGKAPSVTTRITGAPNTVQPKSDHNAATTSYHKKISGDGTDISHYETVTHLTAAMNAKYAQMSKEVQTYIYGRYDEQTQSSFSLMYTRALNGTPKPNRAAYIAAAIAWWEESVMIHFYTQKTAIYAATTEAGLIAVTWDFAQFDVTDPEANIEGAIAITD